LQNVTGWQVEITAEANQAALNALVRAVLPEGWRITKGPAIYRQEKRVTAAVSGDQASDSPDLPETLQEAATRFRETSGFELSLSVSRSAVVSDSSASPAGTRLEINAAYGMLKTALENSTLYRTSLKGDEIVLSFISPQVGERYRAQIEALSRQTGWPLSIYPNPNQGAILEVARALLARAGWTAVKGPSIYPERSEVAVTLVQSPQEQEIHNLADAFEDQTGFHLVIKSSARPANVEGRAPAANAVEIPLSRIRLHPYQQSLVLDPLKLEKAIERARRMGISPPIQVRRVKDGYILMDGLYRLRAAQALELQRIPAKVE
jgi:hypothetical protein